VSEAPRPSVLPAWVGFLAAGLCFVAAGHLFSTAPLWERFALGAEQLPGALPRAAPVGLVLGGLLVLALAWFGPARPGPWRLAAYPLALGLAAAACGATASTLVAFAELRDRLAAGLPTAAGSEAPPAATPSAAPTPLREPSPAPVRAADVEAAEALVGELDDDGEGPANNAVVAELLGLGAAARPALVAAAGAEGHPGRGYAVYALGLLLEREREPDPAGLRALLSGIHHRAPDRVRALAAASLSRIRDPRTVEEMVRQHDPGNRNLVEALERLTGQTFRYPHQAVAWWRESRDRYPPQVLTGEAAREAHSPEGLAVVPTGRAPEELIASFRDDGRQDYVNAATSRVLVEDVGDAAIPALTAAAADVACEGRGWAAWTLARLLEPKLERHRPVESLRAIVSCLETTDPFVRGRATAALATLADPRTLERLLSLCDTEDRNVHEAVRKITGERFDSRAAAETWWERHFAGYPEQVLPPR